MGMTRITIRSQDPDPGPGSEPYRTDLHEKFTKGVSRAKDRSSKFWG